MAKDNALPVDEKLQEQMAQKLDKDFDGHEWYGTELKSDATPIIDPASGKPAIIRMFDFRMDKSIRRFEATKQQVFSAHSKQILTLLWADGLRPIEGVNPRVSIDTRKRTYKIVVAAEPRLHQTVIETPNSLNDVLSTAHKK